METKQSQRPYAMTGSSNPECALWCAVIAQAVDDATMAISYARTKRDRRVARDWLTGNSRDFIQVCTSAGLEPEAVCNFARQRIAETDHSEALALGYGASVVFQGQTITRSALAKRFGMNLGTLNYRLDRLGWPLERALHEPTGRRRRQATEHPRGVVAA